MIEFGETLRKAREEKGLTVSEVAQKTHMLVQQVEALEKEDFSKIAAPIYGRGFVKLYCEAVGIEDPKPLIDEFMDIFTGNRPPTIRMRKSVSPPAEVPPEAPAAPPPQIDADAPIAAKDEEPAPQLESSGADIPFQTTFAGTAAEDERIETPVENAPPSEFLFSLESEIVKPVETQSETPVAEKAGSGEDGEDFLSHPKPPFRKGPSRYAAPQPMEYDRKNPLRFSIPPVVLRIGVLALGAILLIWLVFSGISCLYSATMSPPPEKEPAPDTVETAPGSENEKTVSAPQEEKKPQKRVPMKIPALYVY